jgi:predicted Zn-dependent protease
LQEGLHHEPGNLVLLQHLLDVAKLRHAAADAAWQPLRWDGECVAAFGLVEPGLAAQQVAHQLLMAAAEAVRVVEVENSRAALRQLLSRGTAPALTHLVLGADAWERGRVANARAHYEQAYQLDPTIPPVVNNLAAVLARSAPAELPRALAMMDSLVERAPNEPHYRQNRGEILSRLGRWKEALVDLERALPALPNDRILHGDLAETYQHLDMPEMAAEHRRLARENPPDR